MRRAGIWDIDELDEIERRCFSYGRFSRSIIMGFLRNPFSVTLVVESDRIVASAISIIHSRGAEIASIAVLPEERRKGLAGMLMEEIESIARRKGVDTMSLHVAVDNDGAISLYRKHGYNVTERIADYYGADRPAYYMEKSLVGSVSR